MKVDNTYTKVDELIMKAGEEWNERNERAKRQGQEKLPNMLPLIRLKVSCIFLTSFSKPN